MSAIEWTGRTWNPTLGCSVASPGCDNCYAAKLAHRGLSEAHRGLTVLGPDGVEWTGEVRTHPERLDVPLRVRKPTTWFVDSMSDLFHRDVPDEFVVEVLAVMALTPHHTYQVLTKRPQRMAALLSDPSLPELTLQDVEEIKARSKAGLSAARIGTRYGISDTQARNILRGDQWAERSDWPFVNLWAGASIENDRYAFRADHVRATPAAVRFLSVEPMLGPVPSLDLTGIDWVIIGGESGPGARPMDLDWAGDLMAAAQEAGTAVFVKQVGSVLARRLGYQDGKGGDLTEWPAWLRVREMPQVQS